MCVDHKCADLALYIQRGYNTFTNTFESGLVDQIYSNLSVVFISMISYGQTLINYSLSTKANLWKASRPVTLLLAVPQSHWAKLRILLLQIYRADVKTGSVVSAQIHTCFPEKTKCRGVLGLDCVISIMCNLKHDEFALEVLWNLILET